MKLLDRTEKKVLFWGLLIVLPLMWMILSWWGNPKNVIARMESERYHKEYREAILHYLWR